MAHKDDVIEEIITLARSNNISAGEIAKALADTDKLAAQHSQSVFSRLLGYLGGIFVFAGVCVFIAMYWDDFGSAARVIVTLGTGFTAFVMGLACLIDNRYERASTPLFLTSSLLQPSGIFVMLNEFSSGGDARHGILFMTVYMLIQQGAVFIAKRRTVLAFSVIVFGSIFFTTLCDLWDINTNLTGSVLGLSLLCIATALNQSRHQAIAPFWYFIGSLALLWSVFDSVKNTPFELGYIGLSALIIFVSTYVRSRTLLLTGTVSMLAYIGYFTSEHFADAIGWPVSLVIIGIALIGLSSLAIKLNNRFIQMVDD